MLKVGCVTSLFSYHVFQDWETGSLREDGSGGKRVINAGAK
jgi:hypothetical protein